MSAAHDGPPDLAAVVRFLDETLQVANVPDYPPALNGLQVASSGRPVTRIAAAVDASVRSIQGAHQDGANLLVVHHGLFWGGAQRLTGRAYERVRLLLEHDIALYSAHLPLDVHETHGNSRLLATRLGLTPLAGFARYETEWCGVRGENDLPTSELRDRLRGFAESHGGSVVATPFASTARTRRWAICSGSGANADTLREALDLGVDTLIVGEGPHWTAVDAIDSGLTVLYAGHYATETLGVQSIAQAAAGAFGVTWGFVDAPTGL